MVRHAPGAYVTSASVEPSRTVLIASVMLAMLVAACGSVAPSPAPAATESAPVGEALAITLVAKAIEFTPATISVPAGRPLSVTLDNQDDGVPHSLVLKAGAGFTGELAKSAVQVGPAKLQPLLVPGLVPGLYRWTCGVHPNMTVDMTVDGGG